MTEFGGCPGVLVFEDWKYRKIQSPGGSPEGLMYSQQFQHLVTHERWGHRYCEW